MTRNPENKPGIPENKPFLKKKPMILEYSSETQDETPTEKRFRD